MKHRITPSKTKITDDRNPKRNEVFFGRFVWKGNNTNWTTWGKNQAFPTKNHYSSDLEGFLGTMNA